MPFSPVTQTSHDCHQIVTCTFAPFWLHCLISYQDSNSIDSRQLKHWRLIESFKEVLNKCAKDTSLHPTWEHRARALQCSDYLSLLLFGLINPVVKTTRALCQASRLKRVATDVCSGPVSLGSFSEAQHLVQIELLQKIFAHLAE